MLTKGIDTTIRDLVADMPKSTGKLNTNGIDFETLVSSLATQISSAIVSALSAQPNGTGGTSTAAATAAAVTSSATPSGPIVSDRLNASQLSLLRDRTAPLYELLPSTLTAGDPQYNQREGLMRGQLDLDKIEQRLKAKAAELDVPYDRSDLEGVLRNAGYDASHLGSSERYMSAVERYIFEAEKNYRERATNIPGESHHA
jgi:hypothetical protein